MGAAAVVFGWQFRWLVIMWSGKIYLGISCTQSYCIHSLKARLSTFLSVASICSQQLHLDFLHVARIKIKYFYACQKAAMEAILNRPLSQLCNNIHRNSAMCTKNAVWLQTESNIWSNIRTI